MKISSKVLASAALPLVLLSGIPGALAEEGNSVASSGAKATQWYLNLGVSQLDFKDLQSNTQSGAAEALAEGFSVTSDADDNAWGGRIGVGMFCGDEDLWGQKGSVLWNLELVYTQYEEMSAEIIGADESGSIVSVGESEVSSLGVSFGPHMFIADDIAVYGLLGYTWYETSDSGNIRAVSPDGSQSAFLDSFSDDNVDGTGTFTLGASYSFTDNVSLYLSYQMGLTEVGSADADQPSSFQAGARFSF